MLLTSPGDGGSSLSIDALPPLDSTSNGQNGIEGDRVISIASRDTIVEVDRAQVGRAQSDRQDNPSSTATSPASNTSQASSGIHSTGTSSLIPRSHRQNARLQPLQESELDGLYALRQAGGLKAQRSRLSSWSMDALARLTETDSTEARGFISFAEPLSPLRERDLNALSELFLRGDIGAIEADVKQRLLLLLPEPCWEDHVFDFLKEFL